MKKVLLSLLLLTTIALLAAWFRYGGGEPYPDLTSLPVVDEQRLELVLQYSEPIGNVAVNTNSRVFFTVHPESRHTGNRLLEYVNGASVPFPSIESQLELFDTVLGIVIDRQNRLWSVDHGYHALRQPRLVAIDVDSGEVLLNYNLPKDIAPAGSFLQDVQVSADGRTVVIADASIFRQQPALIVFDVATGAGRRVLENQSPVMAEDYVIRSNSREMTYLGGVFSLRGGVDGIALGPEWLYFAALSGSGLYRVRLDDLRDAGLSDKALLDRVERVADKPLSDGLSIDKAGNVYITDVEHNSVSVLTNNGQLQTLIRSEKIRWPDSLSFGPDGWLYVGDSALPDVILKSRRHIEEQRPYSIFRISTGTDGYPGQ